MESVPFTDNTKNQSGPAAENVFHEQSSATEAGRAAVMAFQTERSRMSTEGQGTLASMGLGNFMIHDDSGARDDIKRASEVVTSEAPPVKWSGTEMPLVPGTGNEIPPVKWSGTEMPLVPGTGNEIPPVKWSGTEMPLVPGTGNEIPPVKWSGTGGLPPIPTHPGEFK